MAKAKKQKWVRPRHTFVRVILAPFFHIFLKLKYGVKIEKFAQENGRQYLVLFNHQTAADQFFVSISFKKHVYYLASEDIFSKGLISTLLRFVVAPIPIKKQTTDIVAIKNCIRVAAEGGTIALAPEGNRTFSGETVYINPSIVYLVKKLKLPLAIYRIEGGYGVHPRWSDVVRKGKMRAYVSRVVEPDEYASMSSEELYELIKDELYVNEANADNVFEHKKRAELLERAIYVCPYCGLSSFKTQGHMIECEKCHRRISFEPTTELKGDGFDFPFRFVNDWYKYQCEYVNSLDFDELTEVPLYQDTGSLSEVIVYKNKKLIKKEIDLYLYSDKLIIDEGKGSELLFPFDKTSAITILGRNKLNVYFGDKIYQIKSHKRFNALKYLNIYNRYVNIKKGDPNVKFLGL